MSPFTAPSRLPFVLYRQLLRAAKDYTAALSKTKRSAKAEVEALSAALALHRQSANEASLLSPHDKRAADMMALSIARLVVAFPVLPPVSSPSPSPVSVERNKGKQKEIERTLPLDVDLMRKDWPVQICRDWFRLSNEKASDASESGSGSGADESAVEKERRASAFFLLRKLKERTDYWRDQADKVSSRLKKDANVGINGDVNTHGTGSGTNEPYHLNTNDVVELFDNLSTAETTVFVANSRLSDDEKAEKIVQNSQSDVVTENQGVRVQCKASFLAAVPFNPLALTTAPSPPLYPSSSSPLVFVHNYKITVTNGSKNAIKLLSREWQFTDSKGFTAHVKGAGVVGQQPVIVPGDSFSYASSTAALNETRGFMRGNFTFVQINGEDKNETIVVPIGPVLLDATPPSHDS